MRRRSLVPCPLLLAVPALVALLAASPTAGSRPQNSNQGISAPAIQVDVAVVDRDEKPVEGLAPNDFVVTVDGKPRRVLWVRNVIRGPGASAEAVRRQVGRSETMEFASESARNVLIVIDELSMQKGSERAAVQAAAALVDRLGLDDRVAVLRIPVTRDASMALTTERPEVRAALRQVVGRAIQSSGRPADPFAADRQVGAVADPNRVAGDPDRAAATERERPPTEVPVPTRTGDEEPLPAGLYPNLQAVLTAMRSSAGRKAVVIFSAGVPASGTSRADDVALAAAASRSVVHVFGLPGGNANPDNALDTAPLERLAKSTGGGYGSIGKNADKSVERLVTELSASYVLGLEPGATDADGKRHPLRVDVIRQSSSVRAPAWLAQSPGASDVVPQQAAAAPAATTSESAAGVAGNAIKSPAVAESTPAIASPRDLERDRLLAKAADYVTGYQREYSMLVAEEHYVQRSKTARQDLRSDLLLVRPAGSEGWESFRDVFEVNGSPVRDRDERLKRLFLESSPEAQAQLKAIKEESARYNIGQVERNINVPLFALRFLEPEHLRRCSFTVGGTKDVGGVAATRLSYKEVAKPTLVRSSNAEDIAAGGWFLIDPASGAVVGSMLQFTFPKDGATIEFTVGYERDTNLGLWVPGEMTEFLSSYDSVNSYPRVLLDARATYSRFRRFQVTVEAEVKKDAPIKK